MKFLTSTINVKGYDVHIWSGGSGLPLLLMHGVGPGTSAAGNFYKVREDLASRYHVFGTDIIGFGNSAVKSGWPYFDYDLWCVQMQAVLDTLPEGPVGLIGHSISGTFALRLAAANKRIDRVLITCPMGTPLIPNQYLESLWSFPRDEEELRSSLRILFNNHSLITDELVASRLDILNKPGYAEYFDKMFGGEKIKLIAPTILSDKDLSAVNCPVSIIHGKHDLAFPYEETTAILAQKMHNVDVHVLSNCSHGPAFERPNTFLCIAHNFFDGST